MHLIIGLGNPGSEYKKHRHNVGFMVVDALSEKYSFGPWKKKFESLMSEGDIGGNRVLLLKPQTYMNESGIAGEQAAKFYKIPMDKIIVIHDELDLEPGRLRIKIGGGAAGHNGLRSLDAHLGQDYKRLRYGIGHPGHKDLVSPYVLHDFSREEMELAEDLSANIAKHFALLLKGDDAGFLNKAKIEFKEE
jgi:PTH1 family peptidyl-tRNA hydrolase